MHGVRASEHEPEGGAEEVREERGSAHQGGAVLRAADAARAEDPQEVQHHPRRHQARQHPRQRDQDDPQISGLWLRLPRGRE